MDAELMEKARAGLQAATMCSGSSLSDDERESIARRSS
jgi:hypothetical protein